MFAALNGANFRPAGAKEIIKSLPIGYDELSLEREPDNQYDSNAIKVIHHDPLDGSETHLGYVEKDIAAEIASQLDAGYIATVKIVGFLSTIKPHLEIELSQPEDE